MKRLFCLSALMILLVLPACRSVELTNVEYEPLLAPADVKLSEVRQGIMRAGLRRNWFMTEVEPGHLEAKVKVRGRHSAEIDIFYDTRNFSIHYKDSENLKYDGSTIHSNYMNWIEHLKTDIKKEMSLMRVS